MKVLKPIQGPSFVYDHVIATGGIGTGIFFELRGNSTLGREESRMAKLLPYKDYCKQHIILHYISVLLGTGKNFNSYAIGTVGDDEAGILLIEQMQSIGININHIKTDPQRATMFSVCFQYPDHSGGNITTDESAASAVTPIDIDKFFNSFTKEGNGLILAAPEVPMPARIRLLEYGRKRDAANIASIASSEKEEFLGSGGVQLTDFLFVNLDEARALAYADEGVAAEKVVSSAVNILKELNHEITVFITCGAMGVYCYHAGRLEFTSSIPVDVVSTAGAGDAFLAGTVAGMCCGLPLIKNDANDTFTAVDLGVAVAAASVTSADTINKHINAEYLASYIPGKYLSKIISE